MAKISRINELDDQGKIKVYRMLVPPSLFEKFNIDPGSGKNRQGEDCLEVDAPPGGTEASLKLMRFPSDRDPLFYIEVSESRDLVQMMWDFIKINDPESPRFDTDVTPEGKSRWLDWKSRNIAEEEKALLAGLAPGQVRAGMRLTRELCEQLDRFCKTADFKSIALEALFYHNAIVYERHGFRYFQGESLMRGIDGGFREGGPLRGALSGTFFRRHGFEYSVRGRSWAIHDNILEDAGLEPWKPPKMYRMVGKKFDINTALGLQY